jgi:hypothetical protein
VTTETMVSLFFVVHATLTTSLGVTGIWGLLVRRHAGLAVLFLLPLMHFPLTGVVAARRKDWGTLVQDLKSSGSAPISPPATLRIRRNWCQVRRSDGR